MADMTAAPARDNLRGILYMNIGIFLLSVMDAVAKWLVEADYPVIQILAVRGWLITIAMLFWAQMRGGIIPTLKTSRWKMHAIRTTIGIAAPFCFFTALKTMPLADATVIFFAAPFIMTALSVPLLKETVGPHRWAAVIVGFIGVVIVMQPGSDAFQFTALIVFIGCVAYALINIMTRWLSSTDSAFQIVFYFNLGTALIASAIAPFFWTSMTWEHFGVVGLMATLALAGHIYMTMGFRVGEISVIVPFEYTSLIWSVLIGYWVWNDLPAEHVWLGAAIIIGGGLYIIHRERPRKPKVILPDV
ncbi:DMT family transporter [Aestuariispira insulae]|uniref:Drug/metabolite transporter (DMT)-like permease n=1 Tax=Aestuariispira insulae TaxID=1461337 RepID=A0A3D9HQJ3_9PROT|nr:DMT family transporter [Aestuariispira insulae]RED51581.1 drug/metabolite transporter (DMT)-like permease [Aestuariispira insulae]